MSILENKKVRTAGVYLLALIMISLVLILFNPSEGGLNSTRLGSVIGLIAIILLPVAFIAHKWRNLIDSSEVFRLEEHHLDEDELQEAVRLWVYVRDKEKVEGDIRFDLGGEGEVNCTYYLKQE